MRKFTSRLCTAAALAATALTAAGAAQADVLFDNGSAGYAIGYSLISGDAEPNHPAFAADSFTLNKASTVNQIVFDSWTTQGDKVTDVEWSIRDSTGINGKVLYYGVTTVTSTHLVTNFYEDDINANSFTVPDLALAAGTYWLELGSADSTYDYGVGWDQTDGGAQFYTNGPWPQPPGNANTFTILGTIDPTGPTIGDGGTPLTPVGPGPGGVPEPAAWALMLLGFGGMGAVLRSARRRGAMVAATA